MLNLPKKLDDKLEILKQRYNIPKSSLIKMGISNYVRGEFENE